ncbi:MAG: hypothetical protein R2881_11385 [Eubacteriales bacterium]
MAGIYIHIPFCVRKCAYCDFVSFPENGVPEAYIDALIQEMELVSRAGGNTLPLSIPCFSAVVRPADDRRTDAPFHGCAQCALPTREDAGALDGSQPPARLRGKSWTFTARRGSTGSIGLQSTHDNLLRSIGRIHTYAQFLDTLSFAREAGFDNINADVMHGLPGQTQSAISTR